MTPYKAKLVKAASGVMQDEYLKANFDNLESVAQKVVEAILAASPLKIRKRNKKVPI